MEKWNKKRVASIAIPSLCVLSLAVALTFSYVSKASNEMVETGEAIQTIDSYEKEGLTTYIGYGYNVVKKDYINADDVTKTNTIFNLIDKNTDSGTVKGIRNTNVIVDSASNDVQTYYINARSVESFLNEFNAKFGSKAKVTAKTDWLPFTCGIASEASQSLAHKKTTQTKSEYVKDRREVKTSTAIWELDECDYYKYLTESFKKDILEMEPEALFEKYGTHFLRSVVLGGRLELNASIEANSTENLDKAVSTFKTSIDVMSKGQNNNANGDNTNNNDNNGINANVEVESDINATLESILKNADIEVSSSCYGGEAKDFASYINTTLRGYFNNDQTLGTEALIGNQSYGNTYSQWLTTVRTRPALVDIYDSDSLYPIWNLLDFFAENDPELDKDVLIERKNKLKEAFEAYGLENYKSIMNGLEGEDNKSMYATMDTVVTGVKDGYSYNKNKKLNEKDVAIHNEYKLGNVIVTNSSKNSDGTMSANSDSLQVMYQLTQDKDNLPVGDTDKESHKLVYDSHWLSSICGYGDVINKFMAGKGAYYVQLVYKDQTTTSTYGSNLLKKLNNGDSTVMFETNASEVDKHGGIDKINVLVIYETMGTSKFGFNSFYNWLEEGSVRFR